MNLGRSVSSQLLDFVPTYGFQLCVDRHQGNRYVKDFSCWDPFLGPAPRGRQVHHQLRLDQRSMYDVKLVSGSRFWEPQASCGAARPSDRADLMLRGVV